MFAAANPVKKEKQKKIDVSNLPTTKSFELRKNINHFISKIMSKKKEEGNWKVSV